MNKLIFVSMACIALSACALTEDVSLKMQLTDKQRVAAEKLRDATQRICVRVQYLDEESKKARLGDMKITEQGKVVRLYSSKENWYKGTVIAQGITDNIFYNESDGRIICGQKNWDEFSNSGSVQFLEVGELEKKKL
jgi:hypothetical protein